MSEDEENDETPENPGAVCEWDTPGLPASSPKRESKFGEYWKIKDLVKEFKASKIINLTWFVG